MEKMVLKKFETRDSCKLGKFDLEMVKETIENEIERINDPDFESESIINYHKRVLHGMELISISLGIRVEVDYEDAKSAK